MTVTEHADFCQIKPLIWNQGKLTLLDQRYLPLQELWVNVTNLQECHESILQMVVRGAPCIGYTAIFGMALFLKNHPQASLSEFEKACEYLKSARPTAVNLAFEIDRCRALLRETWTHQPDFSRWEMVAQFGLAQMEIAEKNHKTMSVLAALELEKLYGKRPLRLMTHCNTGFLACGCWGTALGVIAHLHSLGRVEKVWVDETRPYMQGARLTSYELTKLKIPHHIVVEGAASYLMREKFVDAIFVGADRIVKNGDTANKIGTSTLAIVADHYKVPFYVVAPVSSFDLEMETGKEIKIELRDPSEVLEWSGNRMAPAMATAFNPSFDVTEGPLISGIFCESGVIKPREGILVEDIIGKEKRAH